MILLSFIVLLARELKLSVVSTAHLSKKRGGKYWTIVPQIQSLITQEHEENRSNKHHSSKTAGS